ncbi:MAG: hypothetical protein IKY63_06570, partial [Tidjanibacter sp.]|nr:hypothetical protein [Tidjanibacter sp.]
LGKSPYEHSCVEKEEKAGITEMWAHAVGYIMEREYLGRGKLTYPEQGKYWFKPEIIWDLYRGGMSLKEINQSMTEDVVTLQSFKARLLEDNVSHTSLINMKFKF